MKAISKTDLFIMYYPNCWDMNIWYGIKNEAGEESDEFSSDTYTLFVKGYLRALEHIEENCSEGNESLPCLTVTDFPEIKNLDKNIVELNWA